MNARKNKRLSCNYGSRNGFKEGFRGEYNGRFAGNKKCNFFHLNGEEDIICIKIFQNVLGNHLNWLV